MRFPTQLLEIEIAINQLFGVTKAFSNWQNTDETSSVQRGLVKNHLKTVLSIDSDQNSLDTADRLLLSRIIGLFKPQRFMTSNYLQLLLQLLLEVNLK